MTSPEEPRVAWYMGGNSARHRPSKARMLAYMALAGREGVLGERDLAVTALTTPGPQIRIAPGAFGVLNTAVGGAYEAYTDKYIEQKIRDVPATDATVGGRTDLVILRIKDPTAVGTGGPYPVPESPEDGPYWDIDVIPGVVPNINSVRSHNAFWSAITLARIVRPPNTNVVQNSHLFDLRSLVDLSGERIIILDSPPPTPPPIAQAQFFDVKNQTGSTQSIGPAPAGGGAWTHFPTAAAWDVPIPSWAVGADVLLTVHNIRLQTKGAIGEYRINVGPGDAISAVTAFDLAHTQTIPGWERHPIVAADSMALPPSVRGRVRQFRAELRLTANDGGTLNWAPGTTMTMQIVFKRFPALD